MVLKLCTTLIVVAAILASPKHRDFTWGYRSSIYRVHWYEVHDCFWHGCPRCYARDTVNPVSGKTMQELHCSTVEKIEYLRRQGYKVVEIWECDVNRELNNDEDMKHSVDHLFIYLFIYKYFNTVTSQPGP